MTLHLPTHDQVLESLYHLSEASKKATVAYYFEGRGHDGNTYKMDLMDSMRAAAKALGFDLVSIPQPPTQQELK